MPKNQQTATAIDETQAVEIAIVSTDIAEYKPHEIAVQDIEIRYKNVVFDYSTTTGFEEAKVARAEIREVRYALQNAEKKVLVPYQDAVKAAQATVAKVKQFGADLKAKVLALEDPIDAKIKAKEKADDEEKARKKELERVRIETIQNKLTHFRGVASAYAARSAQDIATMLERVKASVIDPEEYSEFEGEATIARDTAIDSLTALHGLAITREEAAAKAKKDADELEELRKRQQRLDDEAAEQRKAQQKRDQDELDRQRDELKAAQKKLDDQAAQNERDKKELALLRAQTSTATTPATDSAPTVTVVSIVAETAKGVNEVQPESAPVVDIVEPESDITSAAVIEAVAFSFDLTEADAETLLRRLFG